MPSYADGVVHYPDDLPCPQPDTDLVPKERRYISDIGDVKKYRRFQRDYQATRNRVSFVFSPEEGQRFCEWYKNAIFDGGAWFYADWPVLSGESPLAHRFITRPVFTFLSAGYVKVTAQIEVYKRKVGEVQNNFVFTSQLYPVFSDSYLRLSTFYRFKECSEQATEKFNLSNFAIVAGEMTNKVRQGYATHSMNLSNFAIVNAEITERIREQHPAETMSMSNFTIVAANKINELLEYEPDVERLGLGNFAIISGAMQ